MTGSAHTEQMTFNTHVSLDEYIPIPSTTWHWILYRRWNGAQFEANERLFRIDLFEYLKENSCQSKYQRLLESLVLFKIRCTILNASEMSFNIFSKLNWAIPIGKLRSLTAKINKKRFFITRLSVEKTIQNWSSTRTLCSFANICWSESKTFMN